MILIRAASDLRPGDVVSVDGRDPVEIGGEWTWKGVVDGRRTFHARTGCTTGIEVPESLGGCRVTRGGYTVTIHDARTAPATSPGQVSPERIPDAFPQAPCQIAHKGHTTPSASQARTGGSPIKSAPPADTTPTQNGAGKGADSSTPPPGGPKDSSSEFQASNLGAERSARIVAAMGEGRRG